MMTSSTGNLSVSLALCEENPLVTGWGTVWVILVEIGGRIVTYGFTDEVPWHLVQGHIYLDNQDINNHVVFEIYNHITWG